MILVFRFDKYLLNLFR